MTTPPVPAQVWHDRALAADCGRRQAEAAATAYMDADDREGDPYFSTLRAALYRAEIAKADAYALYAEHCSDSAREAEHAARDGRWYENHVSVVDVAESFTQEAS